MLVCLPRSCLPEADIELRRELADGTRRGKMRRGSLLASIARAVALELETTAPAEPVATAYHLFHDDVRKQNMGMLHRPDRSREWERSGRSPLPLRTQGPPSAISDTGGSRNWRLLGYEL